MATYPIMGSIYSQLSKYDVPTLLPRTEGPEVERLSKNAFLAFKRRVSWQYVVEIKRHVTYAILVVNERKNGIQNYIGANTFAEIAVAFNARKRIFILNEWYSMYEEELAAWGAVQLRGELHDLIDQYWRVCSVRQLELFEEADGTGEVNGRLIRAVS